MLRNTFDTCISVPFRTLKRYLFNRTTTSYSPNANLNNTRTNAIKKLMIINDYHQFDLIFMTDINILSVVSV